MAKQISAIVVENKMKNTVTVNILRSVVHPKYGKILQRKTRLKVHIDGQDFKPGEEILIEETKPYSKDVNFKVVQKAEMPKQVRHDKRKKI